MNAVRQREAISHEPQGRVDYRAARSAAVATEQMPIWLQRILGLETGMYLKNFRPTRESEKETYILRLKREYEEIERERRSRA